MNGDDMAVTTLIYSTHTSVAVEAAGLLGQLMTPCARAVDNAVGTVVHARALDGVVDRLIGACYAHYVLPFTSF
jgi:hypothetical protein